MVFYYISYKWYVASSVDTFGIINRCEYYRSFSEYSNEHQKLLIILMAFLSVSVTVTSLEKIQSTFKKVICIGINIVLDYLYN